MASGQQKPPWLKVRACGNEKYLQVQSLLEELHLNTVCREANCPNRGDCFSRGTATFLIMGPNCSRHCRFCNVTHGHVAPLDGEEPAKVARAVGILNLRHAVITSVTRDDLPDGGAVHFARVVEEIRRLGKSVTVELLTPDFRGIREHQQIVLKAAPDIFNHNVETVPRLYPQVRPEADYRRSLDLLGLASDHGVMRTKSGLMVGLGETAEELKKVFDDLAAAGVELLTIGQYLAPSRDHFPIDRYYHPDEFARLGEEAHKAGIKSVFSAPLVRSSFHAEEQYRLSPDK